VTSRTLGVVPGTLPPALTAIEVQMSALDMVVQWRRCGIVADYLADYLALSFEQPDYARSVLSTVANELVENAVRFSAEKARPIRIHASHRGDVVELVVSNLSNQRHVEGLEKLFLDLSRDDLAAVFRERVEAGTRGGLGLLLLAKDYGAELGAVVVSQETDTRAVTMHVVLPAKELVQS